MTQVTFTSTKRSEEKKSSVGIITVKTTRDAVRPYTILSVRNTATGDDLSLTEAVSMGFLDSRHAVYTDPHIGKRCPVPEAADAGLVKIEYTGDAPEPEIETKTYAVRAVVDRRHKKMVTFQEAVCCSRILFTTTPPVAEYSKTF